MIAYVLPTRNRPEALARTLAALGSLPRHDAEVIVVDNASVPPPPVPLQLDNRLPVYVCARTTNEGAAGRNAGARISDPAREWIVMLDDDSHPLDLNFFEALGEQPSDVAAVCAEIFLPSTPPYDGSHSALSTQHSPLFARHESGGLPEVPIGCGVAVRRDAFLALGGYDPSFGFYAEEYDLAARFIREGQRIVMDRRFRVLHEKTPAGRSMDTILRRLVRNNAWVMRRYAPRPHRSAELRRVVSRYGRIAMKERAELGYLAGLAELAWTLPRQRTLELTGEQWDRFTGQAACRQTLLAAHAREKFVTAALVAPGKNDHVVRACLEEIGVRLVDPGRAEALVIGTLSPGPIADAYAALAHDDRVIAPWDVPVARATPGPVARPIAA